MAFIPNFSTTQTLGLPSVINFTDTSIGTDPAIFARAIFILDNNNNPIVPSGSTTTYINWLLANPSQSFDLLNKDYALKIRVDWTDVLGHALYSLTKLLIFDLYLKTFFYSLTQYQASNISITQNVNFYGNKSKLWGYIIGAEQAIILASDISGSQNQLDAGTNMVTNEKLFF